MSDHGSRTEGSRLEIANCGAAAGSKQALVAVKNDGQSGTHSYVLKLTQTPCNNCSGVVCASGSHCDERVADCVCKDGFVLGHQKDCQRVDDVVPSREVCMRFAHAT
jgi:hypothetical protein